MDLAENKISDFFTKSEMQPLVVDSEIWIRTCSEEILEPIEGNFSGKIPEWLNGSLIMNGPGSFTVGEERFNHLFDGMAILQKFDISSSGKITYQNKFIKSEAYKQNNEHKRIMFGEFGTAAKSQGLFKKLMSLNKSNLTDNTLVSFYPICDDYYALTEAASVNRIDPKTLEVLEKTNFSDLIGVAILTAHPHVMPDGSTYNVGHSISATGGFYNVICFPEGEKDIKNAKVVAKVPSRFKYHPTYIHSFGITEHFFIILETPFVMSIPLLAKSMISEISFIDCLKWLNEEQTRIILIDRETGTLAHSFFTDPFFCFHTINQFEKNGEVILDLCCYENADVVDAVHIEKLSKNDPKAIGEFCTKPLRFVLPLKAKEQNVNLVKFEGSTATAILTDKMFCTPELLCDIGFEFPRINYPKYVASEYQYFYGVCVDLTENVGALIKVDTKCKTRIFWKDESSYAWEPIFVPSPHAISEDDGVIVAGFLTSGTANRVGVVILDALNLKELARSEFNDLPTEIPKPFHGWFIADE